MMTTSSAFNIKPTTNPFYTQTPVEPPAPTIADQLKPYIDQFLEGKITAKQLETIKNTLKSEV